MLLKGVNVLKFLVGLEILVLLTAASFSAMGNQTFEYNPETARTLATFYKENPNLLDQDLEKYRFSLGKKIGKSAQISIPVAMGLGLAFTAGPQAVVPLTIGSVLGTLTMVDFVKKKNVRDLIKGAFYFLANIDGDISAKQHRKVKEFHKFFRSTDKDLRESVFTGLGEQERETFLAMHLLRINHYSWQIAFRYRADEQLRELNQIGRAHV